MKINNQINEIGIVFKIGTWELHHLSKEVLN